jgi:hypothetical protein
MNAEKSPGVEFFRPLIFPLSCVLLIWHTAGTAKCGRQVDFGRVEPSRRLIGRRSRGRLFAIATSLIRYTSGPQQAGRCKHIDKQDSSGSSARALADTTVAGSAFPTSRLSSERQRSDETAGIRVLLKPLKTLPLTQQHQEIGFIFHQNWSNI